MNRGLCICVCGELWQAEALLVATLGVFEENVRRGSLPKTAGTAARNTGTIVRMNSLVDFLLLLFVASGSHLLTELAKRTMWRRQQQRVTSRE